MNQRELQQIEKKSIHSIKINNDLKDSIINLNLNDLNKVIKSNSKRKNLLVLVVEID